MMAPTQSPPMVNCETCRNMRHVPRDNGSFARCPDCYAKSHLQREFAVRQYPQAWTALEPARVIAMFGAASPVGQTMDALLTSRQQLVHAYGLPTDRRQAFVGALAYGFLTQGKGAQVLDAADLAFRHFTKDTERWTMLERNREAAIFTLGREVETRLGFFYLRSLLDRAVNHGLPLVLVTDYPLEVHAPRYPDLMPVIEAARFDRLNLPLSD